MGRTQREGPRWEVFLRLTIKSNYNEKWKGKAGAEKLEGKGVPGQFCRRKEVSCRGELGKTTVFCNKGSDDEGFSPCEESQTFLETKYNILRGKMKGVRQTEGVLRRNLA